jgi:hypothetical protein
MQFLLKNPNKTFFIGTEQVILKCICKVKGMKIAKTVFLKNNRAE